MGTTAEKFSRLAQSKREIRAQLILKGGGITKTTPFKDYAAALAALNVEQPQLHAGTISNSNGVITFADDSDNGDFCTRFAVYVDGEYLADAAASGSVNLYDYINEDGTYSVTAKSLGQYFKASDASTALSVTLAGSGKGYAKSANSYGYTATLLTTYSTESNDYGLTAIIDQTQEG